MSAFGASVSSVLTSPAAGTVATASATAAASAVAGATAKKLWRKATGSAEQRELVEPIALAFVRAIEDSRLHIPPAATPPRLIENHGFSLVMHGDKHKP